MKDELKYNLKSKVGEEMFPENEGGGAIPVEGMIIEKHGSVQELSINEILGDLKAYDRKIVELTSNKSVYDATIVNIEHHNPWVKEMSEHDRIAVFLYQEALAYSKACAKHIAAIEEQKTFAAAEIADIKAQIPELSHVEIPETVKPDVPAVPAPEDAPAETATPVEDATAKEDTTNANTKDTTEEAAPVEQEKA